MHSICLAQYNYYTELSHQVSKDKQVEVPKNWTKSSFSTSVPIGLLPNGEFPDLSLPLELDEHKYGMELFPILCFSTAKHVISYISKAKAY